MVASVVRQRGNTVCEAVNAAFADNPAAGCAVGVDGSALSIIMRLQDLDTLPTQMPALTPAGRPTLKTMAKRDRMRWWMHILVSNLAATVSEALATAPSITAVNAAVITRMPDTARLGLIAYGSWSRDEVERVSWRTADDAWRLLDIGTDVRCGIKRPRPATSPPLSPRCRWTDFPVSQRFSTTAKWTTTRFSATWMPISRVGNRRPTRPTPPRTPSRLSENGCRSNLPARNRIAPTPRRPPIPCRRQGPRRPVADQNQNPTRTP